MSSFPLRKHRSPTQVSTCMGKMPMHLWSHDGWGRGRGEGVKEKGMAKTVAAYNATLFCFFWRIRLLTLVARCVPSFLLSLAIEDGLNYWVFCSLNQPKQVPLNSTFSFSMLLTAPKTYFVFSDSFHFFQ